MSLTGGTEAGGHAQQLRHRRRRPQRRLRPRGGGGGRRRRRTCLRSVGFISIVCRYLRPSCVTAARHSSVWSTGCVESRSESQSTRIDLSTGCPRSALTAPTSTSAHWNELKVITFVPKCAKLQPEHWQGDLEALPQPH